MVEPDARNDILQISPARPSAVSLRRRSVRKNRPKSASAFFREGPCLNVAFLHQSHFSPFLGNDRYEGVTTLGEAHASPMPSPIAARHILALCQRQHHASFGQMVAIDDHRAVVER
jgi:hypothetical protein